MISDNENRGLRYHYLFVNKNSRGASLKSTIDMYEWLRKTGAIKHDGAAMNRLKELKLQYKSGKRYQKWMKQAQLLS